MMVFILDHEPVVDRMKGWHGRQFGEKPFRIASFYRDDLCQPVEIEILFLAERFQAVQLVERQDQRELSFGIEQPFAMC